MSDNSNYVYLLSWKSLILRVFIGYVIFVLAYQLWPLFPPLPHLSLIDSILRATILPAILFFPVFFALSILAILVAKIPKIYRGLPLQPFLYIALKILLIISIIFFFLSWFSYKSIDMSQKILDTQQSEDKASERADTSKDLDKLKYSKEKLNAEAEGVQNSVSAGPHSAM